MNKNRAKLWVLPMLTGILLILGVIVLLTEDKLTINANPIDRPVLVLIDNNDNIELELNLDIKIEHLVCLIL